MLISGGLESLTNSINNILTAGETIFGKEGSGTSIGTAESITEGTATVSGEGRERLEISDEAIDKIVSDILSGPEGLASIFAGEQNSGIFDSSVAAQAAGDLAAKISGEIARLRAERVQTENRTQTQTQSTKQTNRTDTNNKKKGLLNKIFGF